MSLYLRVKRVPIAAGLVAAFGSIWLSWRDQLYLTNSYSSFLWDFFVPGFLKSSGSEEHLPRNSIQPPDSRRRARPDVQIRRNEKRVLVNHGLVAYFETNNLASNEPIEDRNSEYLISKGALFGVFDGHSGWQCAEEVTKRLPYYVALSMLHDHTKQATDMNRLMHNNYNVKNLQNDGNHDITNTTIYGMVAKEFYKSMPLAHTGVEGQLKNAFRLLDEDIVTEAMPSVNGYAPEEMLKGLSGACAITAYIEDGELYVANTGDCRAVLGSKVSDGEWHVTSLSVDQTAANDSEVKRIKQDHPKENFVVMNNRLLGILQPFRAFGDVILKWDYNLHKEVLNKLFKRVVIPDHLYCTPPYLTAEPVITYHQLRAEDQFMVIATDGLWDMMSSERAVKCIGELIDSGELVAGSEGELSTNGASELIQEALGGQDNVKVSALLAAPKHIRRAVRDDITVTVVYFRQAPN